jgi:hypothetical protein
MSQMDDGDPLPRPGFLFELRDAISVRTFLLVFGVLLLQLGFIVSYVGAFHAPKPVRTPVGVVAPSVLASAQQRVAQWCRSRFGPSDCLLRGARH